MVKKRGLGKPLDALLTYGVSDSANDQHDNSDQLKDLSISKLIRGKYQPRREIDPATLEDLTLSIKNQGVIQPIVVRPSGDKYEIIAGERRTQAAKLAGLTTVPAIVRQIPDEAALAIALIENIQREDLNPIEEAIAINRLIDEFKMTHQQAAQAVGRSRTSITNLLRLLSLPESIREMIELGKLEMGHARALITLPEEAQLNVAQMITSKSLSVREAEYLVKKLQSHKKLKDPSTNPDLRHLQENLARTLNMRVAIQCNAQGKGKVVIHYRNLNELDQLMLQFTE